MLILFIVLCNMCYTHITPEQLRHKLYAVLKFSSILTRFEILIYYSYMKMLNGAVRIFIVFSYRKTKVVCRTQQSSTVKVFRKAC